MVRSTPMPKTHEDRIEALQEYVDLMRQDLQLNDWDVTISVHTPNDETTMAQMDITSTRHHGALRIGSAFWKAEPSEQRYVLAHELVHLHLRRLGTIVEGTEAALGANAFSMLSHSFNIAEEYATDALASVIANQFKLPEFGDGK